MMPRPPSLSFDAGLDDVPSTLLIPLAARAHGDTLFPALSVDDRFAAKVLRQLNTNVQHFIHDRPSVYGVLARTRIFRDLASQFFDRFPRASGANLGCGLACYFQWLDRHTNRWLDADLPQVITLRKRLLPGRSKRHRCAEVDLRYPGWWKALGLACRDKDEPTVLILEGVLMYLDACEVNHLLWEFGEHAPEGSELLCDTLSWLSVGSAALHPSVGYTHAQFRWGPKRQSDFTACHPRLRVKSEHAVMDSYDLATAFMCSGFKALWGVPFYGITRLGV